MIGTLWVRIEMPSISYGKKRFLIFFFVCPGIGLARKRTETANRGVRKQIKIWSPEDFVTIKLKHYWTWRLAKTNKKVNSKIVVQWWFYNFLQNKKRHFDKGRRKISCMILAHLLLNPTCHQTWPSRPLAATPSSVSIPAPLFKRAWTMSRVPKAWTNPMLDHEDRPRP